MRRIGNPTGLRGVWLTPGAAVKHRFRVGMRHDSQKSLPNDSANLLHPPVESKAEERPLRNGNRRVILHMQYRIVKACRWPLLLHSRSSAEIGWRIRFSGCYGERLGLQWPQWEQLPNQRLMSEVRSSTFQARCRNGAVPIDVPGSCQSLPGATRHHAVGRGGPLIEGIHRNNVKDRLGRTSAMEGRRQAMLIAR